MRSRDWRVEVRSGAERGARRSGRAVGLLCVLAATGAVPIGAQELPRLHHAHLNSVDPGAAIDWYLKVWPDGTRGEVAGHPAFLAELPLLFNRVDTPPAGAWDRGLQRADPQSPFWHIGGFVNTTGLFERLRSEGVSTIDLEVGPGWGDPVARSGLTPYAGVLDAEGLAVAERAEPRPGGFGYLEGPDGALVEMTGSPNTNPAFAHVHLFHEEPRCAANWYVDVLGFRHAPFRDRESGERRERERWDPCSAPRGERGWPSLERAGSIRSPNATIVHAGGGLSIYPRQGEAPLVPSRGQVLDHVAFEVVDLDAVLERARAAGTRVLRAPYALGSDRAALLEGPDGLSIEVVESAGG